MHKPAQGSASQAGPPQLGSESLQDSGQLAACAGRDHFLMQSLAEELGGNPFRLGRAESFGELFEPLLLVLCDAALQADFREEVAELVRLTGDPAVAMLLAPGQDLSVRGKQLALRKHFPD